MVANNHQVQTLRRLFIDLARNLVTIINIFLVKMAILDGMICLERADKMFNLAMREDEFSEMGQVDIEKGGEDRATYKHEYSDDYKLGVGEDFHVDGGHGRDGDGRDRSEEDVQVMET